MIATALALLFAHTAADYIAQTDWMVAEKRRPAVLALHVLIVAALSLLALGGAWQAALAVTAAHAAIDLVKTYALPDRLWAYLGDQGAHLAAIAGAAWLWPGAFDSGLWAAAPAPVLPALLLASGGIYATWGGSPVVQLLLTSFKEGLPAGLTHAGRMIGLLERAMIYLMVLIGEPTGIGFLIAAKSILRFDTASRDQKASEYVIIGTLASFGWALTLAFVARAGLAALTGDT